MTQGLRVFISSTELDLRPQRAAAKEAVLAMGWQPVMMEYFELTPKLTVQACLEKVEGCDLVIWIAGYRHGWVPSVDQGGDATRSITEHELDRARALKIPILQFFAKQWPYEEVQKLGEAQVARANALREASGQAAAFFTPEDSFEAVPKVPVFKATVKTALDNFKAQRQQAPSTAAIESVSRSLRRGVVIPFIGCGAHGGSPLSSSELARDLASRLDGRYRPARADPLPLPTAAEYLWRQYNDRNLLLDAFQEAITNAAGQVASSPVADLLAAHPKPPLIVSTSYDLVLEERLADRKLAIVCHVMRARETEDDDQSRDAAAEHEGRVLVLRRAPGVPDRADVMPADRVSIAEDEWVIYKPLGSPLLHARLPPAMADVVDTVVATETDYVTFLSRLNNQHTQIPELFFRPLQQKALLFVGYALDVWNYRLIMQVFQAVKRRQGQASVRAVRPNASEVEALLWSRFNVDVEPSDPGSFATSVLAQSQPPARPNPPPAPAGP